MQNPTKPVAREIGVLLFNGFSNYCLANAVEPLRAANTFCGVEVYRWQFLTVDGTPAVSSSGLPVVPRGKLSGHPGGDVLFLLPSYGFRHNTGPQTLNALRSASRRFAFLAGMDTGAWLMAAAGLLDGHRATIHWDEYTEFAERFPEVGVVADRCVHDRDRMTCGGASTAFDLVLQMIQQNHGPKIRMEIRELFMPSESPDLRDIDLRPNASTKLDTTIARMRRHIEEVLTIPEIARRTGQNQKSMERLFRDELNLSPAQAYRYLRLNEARRLLAKTRLNIAEIALRCGYADASAMTRAFGTEFGVSPRAWRGAVVSKGASATDRRTAPARIDRVGS